MRVFGSLIGVAAFTKPGVAFDACNAAARAVVNRVCSACSRTFSDRRRAFSSSSVIPRVYQHCRLGYYQCEQLRRRCGATFIPGDRIWAESPSSLSGRTKFRVIWRSRACRMVAESPHAAHSGPKQPQLSRTGASNRWQRPFRLSLRQTARHQTKGSVTVAPAGATSASSTMGSSPVMEFR